jgi:outer membrane protein OmpA-like peptidoglycan-associated protein
MSFYVQIHRRSVVAMLFAAVAVLCSAGSLATAHGQTSSSAPAPHQPATTENHAYPKWEVFGGYSFFYPGASLHALNPGASLPLSIRQESNPRGAGGSLTYNFNRWFGLTADGSGNWGSGEGGPNLSTGNVGKLDDLGFYQVSAGPKLTYRKAHFAPFAEGLAGWHHYNSEGFGSDSGFGFLAGGGIDVPLGKHFGLRPIQGDYVFSNRHFGPSPTVATTQIRGARLQSGVIFMFGGMAKPAPVSYSCSASPTDIFPGDPVAVSGSALNLNPKRNPAYNWTSTGGKVSGTSSTSNVNTTGLAPGTYTVTGHVTEGPKPGQSADCNTTFTVKPFDPPTVALSANPSTVNPGDSSAITAQGASPQNRPLTYSYSTSAGQVSGSGTNATLNTTGVAPGVVTVTGKVVDDTGQTASATTSVTINAPPQPPAPKTETLCSMDFGRDTKRPYRVDNEAKACLDEVALNLQRNSDARAVLVGNSAPAERNAAALAAERAVNTKAYLVGEKGIDPSRIEVRTGTAGNPSVQNYLVPSGADFNNDVPGTSAIDTSTVKASSNAYGRAGKMPGHHHRTRKSTARSSPN